jgi:hypothetical protein
MYEDNFESAKPSSTLGGMLSSLFRGGSRAGMSTSGIPGAGGLTGRKVLGGALLAAGAAYLYNRSKGRSGGTSGNSGFGGTTPQTGL